MSAQRRLEQLSGVLVNSCSVSDTRDETALYGWLVHDNQELRKRILDFLKVRTHH